MAITGFLAAINQERLILGKQADENTPATTGFYLLNASKLLPKRESRFDTYRGAGSKVVGVSRQNTEHATLALSGGLDYNELGFFIDMALKNLTSAAVVGSTGAYSHTADLAFDAENVINWYTAFWGKVITSGVSLAYVARALDSKAHGLAKWRLRAISLASALKIRCAILSLCQQEAQPPLPKHR